VKKIVILIIVSVMVFSSFVIVFNVNYQPGISHQNVVSKSPTFVPYTGAGSSQTISAELNYTQAGVSTTFDKIQASVSHTQFDIGQSVTIHFSNSYVCRNPVSGMPPNSTGKMVIEEQSPTTTFLKSHYANVTYSSTEEATTYANFTDDFASTIVFTFFVEAYVDYSETGKDYKNVSAAITISVNADPSVSISDNQTVSGYVDTNTTVKFTSSANGGWIPYAYQWFTNGTALTGQTSSDYTKDFTSPGTYKDISVCTTDETGYVVLSNLITDQVAYPPKVNMSATQQKVDANQHVEFFSNLIHGNGKVSLTWSINGTVVSGQTGRDFNKTFTGSGKYNISVRAEDQAGVIVSSNLTEKVYPPLSSKIYISKKYIDEGQKVTYRLNTTGSSGVIVSSSYCLKEYVEYGTSPLIYAKGNGTEFNYTFSISQTEFVGTTYSGYSYQPTYVNLSFKAKTSTGATTYQDDPLILVHQPPSLTVGEEFGSRDVGLKDTFTPSGNYVDQSTCSLVYGGSSPYILTWQVENITTGGWNTVSTYSGSNPTPLNYTFTIAGTYDVRAHLVDAAGYQINSSAVEVTVNPKLELNVSVNPSKIVDMHIPEVCSSITVITESSGGSSLDTSTFEMNGVSEASNVNQVGNTYDISHSMPQNPGRYEYCVFASDSTGGSAKGYGNFTVLANDMSIAMDVPGMTVQGNAYSLDASASAPSYFSFVHDFNLVGYSYQWHIGKTIKTGNSIVYDFSNDGTYIVNLTVKANYVTEYNGQELSAYQEKNMTQSVRVVNSSSSNNIHIKQFKYETSSNYYFDYWISFTDSSYSTSFYAINHTAYTPQDVQTYANGSVFVNVSVQDSNYAPGTQDICFTVINNESQTNSVNGTFIISLSQSNQISIYTIANFFGGFYNFLIFIATVGALVIGYASFRESKRPPVIDITQPNGKTSAYQLQGKKIKKGGR
jgi:hypothetical protein